MRVLAEVAAEAERAVGERADRLDGEPRFDADLGDRLFVLEAVYEGYLLHYGTPRIFDGMDGDLRLLTGDALYALGLARLAESGDLAAVAELSALISRSAQAHAEGHGQEVEAMWEASAEALGASSG